MPTTRAKFRCNRIELQYCGDKYEDGAFVEPREALVYPKVVMTPVMAQPGDDDHENSKFWQASPSGELWMQINNPAGAEVFEIGREYYVDFTPA